MANRRTAVPEGYYVVERWDGRLAPYHRADDMMETSDLVVDEKIPPETLVPIGPSFSRYIDAARFCYVRAGVAWPHRKRVKKRGEAESTSTPSQRQAATAEHSRVLPEKLENTSGERQAKRSHSRGSASGVRE